METWPISVTMLCCFPGCRICITAMRGSFIRKRRRLAWISGSLNLKMKRKISWSTIRQRSTRKHRAFWSTVSTEHLIRRCVRSILWKWCQTGLRNIQNISRMTGRLGLYMTTNLILPDWIHISVNTRISAWQRMRVPAIRWCAGLRRNSLVERLYIWHAGWTICLAE